VGAGEDGLCSLPRLRGVEILAGERQGAEAVLATLAEESLDYADSPHRERASAAGHVQAPHPVGVLAILFSGLPCVALYCVRGDVRVVSDSTGWLLSDCLASEISKTVTSG
jgi:hypothetical protein